MNEGARWDFICKYILLRPSPLYLWTTLPTETLNTARDTDYSRNAIAGGNTLGPLICGFIVTNKSWRWHKWIAVILTAVNFLTIILFVPETRYKRQEVVGVGMAICPSNDKIIAADEKFLGRSSDDEELQQTPKKSWRQELSPWSGVSDTRLATMFVRPFPMLVYPPVIYAFLAYSISLVITVAVNILNPFVLQAPPYNWSPQINGLINIPGILGNLFGAWAGGKEHVICKVTRG
jgi:MFS family permease